MKSKSMYDIFMRFADGSPLWLEAVEGLEEARTRLARLVSTSEAEYFIYSEKSGGIIERASAADDPTPCEEVGQMPGPNRLSLRLQL